MSGDAANLSAFTNVCRTWNIFRYYNVVTRHCPCQIIQIVELSVQFLRSTLLRLFTKSAKSDNRSLSLSQFRVTLGNLDKFLSREALIGVV